MNSGTGTLKEQSSNTSEKPALKTLLCQMQIPEAPALNEQKKKNGTITHQQNCFAEKEREEISRIP